MLEPVVSCFLKSKTHTRGLVVLGAEQKVDPRVLRSPPLSNSSAQFLYNFFLPILVRLQG